MRKNLTGGSVILAWKKDVLSSQGLKIKKERAEKKYNTTVLFATSLSFLLEREIIKYEKNPVLKSNIVQQAIKHAKRAGELD